MATREQELIQMMHRDWMYSSGRPWMWLIGMAMMAVFWGGIIWAIVSLVRRGGNPPSSGPQSNFAPPTPRVSAEEILAERLARGEIDPDEYRHRLDALRTHPPAPSA